MLVLYIGKAGDGAGHSSTNHPRIAVRLQRVGKEILVQLHCSQINRLCRRATLRFEITDQLFAKVHELLQEISVRVGDGKRGLVGSSEKVWVRLRGLAKSKVHVARK